MTDLERRVAALEARESARDLLFEYAFALDTGRWDELAALFCEDATLHMINVPGPGESAVHHGRDDIGAVYRRAGRGGLPRFRHYTSNVSVQLVAELHVELSAFWLAVTDTRDDTHGISGGLYEDEYVDDGERWRIKTKRIVRTWAWQVPKTAEWVQEPAATGSTRSGRPAVAHPPHSPS